MTTVAIAEPDAAMAMTANDSAETPAVSRHEVTIHVKIDQTRERERAVGEETAAEEALETHEVVELSKFTERKEWIEEKIKLLESMPPIDVFAGVDTFQTNVEEIPFGIPTRTQLSHWLEEHDGIEKETEIFDAEDMSKLKKLTKAATQRNLSPEDTDLIELTLTTLLALDKLLHLLRDRSESLDLLGLRLTWEEQRLIAWKERRSIFSDLEVFLTTRARWTLDTYELPLPSTPSPSPAFRFTSPSPSTSPRPSSSLAKRRDSAASLASFCSDTSSSIISPSATFSRSTRYKLAELLSHDAALISGRLTSLNHGKVMAAGKTLDKLIDTSRKPVPDEILDEQDRLEDEAVKEIETAGKFAMSVVMQWKWADEYHNDIMKDQSAAQALMIELNSAELHHPTSRHDAAFSSRAQALLRRLGSKGDPTLPRSSFPRPVHPLFPDQTVSNEAIVKTLSTEFSEALKLARQVDAAARAYHHRLEAVKEAETLRDNMQGIERQLEVVAKKLVEGMHDGHEHGDPSPPDLTTEMSLEPMRHAMFLALLPSVIQEFDQAHQATESALRDSMVVSLRLKELPGIDPIFQEGLGSTMQTLQARRDATRGVRDDVLARVQKLKEARRLWDILMNIMDDAEDVKRLVLEGMECQRWKSSEGRQYGAPVTPDSDSPQLSQTVLPVPSTSEVQSQRLNVLTEQLSTDFKEPLGRLISYLEQPISLHLQSSSDGLERYIQDVSRMVRLWDRIIKQREAIMLVEHEGGELSHRINALQVEVDDLRQGFLQGDQGPEVATSLGLDLHSRTVALRESVQTFTDSLATRVPMVSSMVDRPLHFRHNSFSSFSTSFAHQVNRLKSPPETILPFDPVKLDEDVRTAGNVLALRLAGGMQSLAKKFDYLQLSRLAKIADNAAEVLAQVVRDLESEHSNLKSSFESAFPVTSHPGSDTLSSVEKLASMIELSDQIAEGYRTRLAGFKLAVEQSLQTLQDAPGAFDSPVHGVVVVPRVKSAGDILQQADSQNEIIMQLRTRIVKAKLEADARLHLEKEHLAAEEERRRLDLEEQAGSDGEEPLCSQADERAGPGKDFTDTESSSRIELTGLAESEHSHLGNNSQSEHVIDENINEAQVEIVIHPSTKPVTPDEDVFGLRLAPADLSVGSLPPQMTDLRVRIMSLRTRLRSLSLGNKIRTPAYHAVNANTSLPSLEEVLETRSSFASIATEVAALPASVEEDALVDSELKSLRSELDAANGMVERLMQLGQVCEKVAICDHALSDLLEHADSYPAAPTAEHLASSHISDIRLPCETQLANRLAFTKRMMDEMHEACRAVGDDSRVAAEQARVQQTWSELSDMCTDRMNGARSRSGSSLSSTGRSTSVTNGFLNPRNLKPTLDGIRPLHKESGPRRALSSTHDTISRPPTHLSNRSISNPSRSSLFNTTFASRQRTSSLVSIPHSPATPFKRPMSPITRPRMTSRRPGSPIISEVSGPSTAYILPKSTWSRAPRQSFGSVPKSFQTPDTAKGRTAYVANPRSRLDVAVGNIVNNCTLPVTIQAAGDGWRDQSGKYWIGDAEPKLCFCRILRSQTVMVRVGGGWSELSKFLRGHFAELLPDSPSPPRKEERWINAVSVREAMEATSGNPTTPEPKQNSLPSFQLSTPSGSSPRLLKSSSSPTGSSPGLTPFQFMRRADIGLRAATPSPTRSTRTKPIPPGVTPSRPKVWRP